MESGYDLNVKPDSYLTITKMNNIDTYLMKALDSYPFNLECTLESLNYALSSDENNPYSYHLLGRIHMEQFSDLETAIQYFEKAMAIDFKNSLVISSLSLAYIQNGDYEKAKKLLDYAFKLKGVDQEIIAIRSFMLLEKQELFNLALKQLNVIQLASTSDENKSFISQGKQRIKEKLKIKKKLEKMLEKIKK
jgi:tetratricopeptide (TPR) repeat protein